MAVFKLRIIKDKGVNPRPYTWEIYLDGQDHPIEKSTESYSSALVAKLAGNAALRQLTVSSK